MSVREQLRNNPKLGVGIGAGAIALAGLFLALQFSGAGGPSDEAFFTTDQGQTWFADDADKIPPFLKDGKEAVRAYVYECPGDGKQFVNHLERYTPEMRKQIDAALAEAQKTGKPPSAAMAGVRGGGVEIKKPGDKEWVPIDNRAKSGPILNAKCPDGGQAVPIFP